MQEEHYQKFARLPREFIESIMAIVYEHKIEPMDKEQFIKRKAALTRIHHLDHVPSDIEIMTYLDNRQRSAAKELLLTKPVRTNSGVTVVAVMTKPLPCPHGKCTYCPGGVGSFFGDVPQSYTGHEPATLRGIRANYDAYTQIFNRLEQYIVSGHNPEKVELILMGGTFPSYDNKYQDEVVHDIFQAMNDFSEMFFKEKGAKEREYKEQSKKIIEEKKTTEEKNAESELDVTAFNSFFMLPGNIMDKERTGKLQEKILSNKISSARRSKSTHELQLENECATIRCIGFTIETRPSHAKASHASRMLDQGCTRVELGVQTTFDDVLTKVHRDHTVQDTIDAIADLRDLGFKLNFHVMLGLPLMTPARDIEAAHRLFDDQSFRPDMLKVYPCMVMPGTPLFYEWKKGSYTPYTTQLAAETIAQIKRFVPPYVRIMRIQRDIPTKVTTAGVGLTNLRQIVDDICKKEQIYCGCIRCREAKESAEDSTALNIIEYDASGGNEFFISIDEKSGKLHGFCRLRFPGRCLRAEITPTSGIIRELHVYGTAAGIGSEGKVQHKGIGRKLMEAAEKICKEYKKDKLLVISGVGVRQYYKRLGYSHDGPYMSKRL